MQLVCCAKGKIANGMLVPGFSKYTLHAYKPSGAVVGWFDVKVAPSGNLRDACWKARSVRTGEIRAPQQ